MPSNAMPHSVAAISMVVFFQSWNDCLMCCDGVMGSRFSEQTHDGRALRVPWSLAVLSMNTIRIFFSIFRIRKMVIR